MKGGGKKKTEPKTRVCEVFRSFFRGLRCGHAGRLMTLTMWDLLKSGWLCFFSSLTDGFDKLEPELQKEKWPSSQRARLCRCVFASVCIILLVCLFMIVSIKNCTACRNWLAEAVCDDGTIKGFHSQYSQYSPIICTGPCIAGNHLNQ